MVIYSKSYFCPVLSLVVYTLSKSLEEPKPSPSSLPGAGISGLDRVVGSCKKSVTCESMLPVVCEVFSVGRGRGNSLVGDVGFCCYIFP